MKYKVLSAATPINEAQLEELANQGWYLIAILPWNGLLYFYFSYSA
jgi:hypothetical protein